MTQFFGPYLFNRNNFGPKYYEFAFDRSYEDYANKKKIQMTQLFRPYLFNRNNSDPKYYEFDFDRSYEDYANKKKSSGVSSIHSSDDLYFWVTMVCHSRRLSSDMD